MKIAAVGAGRMGRGIALAFAYAGYDVALVDLKARSRADWEKLREDAMAEMQASLAMLAELGAMPADAVQRIMGRINVAAQSEATLLSGAEIVFEAVPADRCLLMMRDEGSEEMRVAVARLRDRVGEVGEKGVSGQKRSGRRAGRIGPGVARMEEELRSRAVASRGEKKFGENQPGMCGK